MILPLFFVCLICMLFGWCSCCPLSQTEQLLSSICSAGEFFSSRHTSRGRGSVQGELTAVCLERGSKENCVVVMPVRTSL